MASKINDIHLRRGQLLERIAHQRTAIREESLPVQAVLLKTDRLLDYSKKTTDFITQHLGIFLIVGTFLLIRKPGASWRLAQRSFLLWKLWQSLNKKWALFSRLIF